MADDTVNDPVYIYRERIVARESQRIRDMMRVIPQEEDVAKKNQPRPKPIPKLEVPAVLHAEEPPPNAPKTHHALALVDRELLAAVRRANGEEDKPRE